MMVKLAAAIVLFLCCLSIQSRVECRKLSKQEDLELERLFEFTNKSTVKTIQTIHGDIYNCMYLGQQQATIDYLHKNYTFDPKAEPTTIFNPRVIWKNGKGCPIGSIPIRKTTKDDLLRAKLASEIHASNFNPQTTEIPGLHFTIFRTKVDPNKKYHGSSSVISVWNPQVQDSQSSYARIKIQNGAEYIEAGWTVNPTLYKDKQTRLYVYTNAGQSRCFNMFCPGFKLTYPWIPIDQVLQPYSTRGGSTYATKFRIEHETMSGNWVLKIGQDMVVGFWDSSIFTGLKNHATYIDWGGQVYGPSTLPSPQMGSGFLVTDESTKYDAYFMRFSVANETHFRDVDDDVEKFIDIDAFNAYNGMDKGYTVPDTGRLFFYGGPGGYVGN